MESKCCSRCKEIKALDEFHIKRRSKDGHSPHCKVCEIERQRQYRKNHYGEYLAIKRRYRNTHQKEIASCRKLYYETHSDSVLATVHRYRARIAGVSIEDFDARDVWQYWGNICAYCGSTENLTLDHIVPLSNGGAHSPDNLCVACRFCNSSKSNKGLTEWMLWKARRAELEAAANI